MSRVKHSAICQECVQFMVKLQKQFNAKPPPGVDALLTTLRAQMALLLQTWLDGRRPG